jgi:hypothetical protein
VNFWVGLFWVSVTWAGIGIQYLFERRYAALRTSHLARLKADIDERRALIQTERELAAQILAGLPRGEA